MPASIHDVAERAGVSIATVSRAFTQPAKVLPKTRERVLETAHDMGFTISRSASALKSGKAARIAFLTGGELESWYDSHILSGLNSVLHNAGYDISVYQVSDSQERHDFFSDMSINRNADAVLVVSFQVSHDEAAKLKSSGIPLIGINTTPMPEFSATINLDEQASMRMVVNHLAQLGHRDIAYVCLDPETETFKWNGQDRLNSIKEICKEGPDINLRVIYAPKDVNRADYAFSQLTTLERRPTAICCINDEYAVPLLALLLRNGLRIPSDVSLIGFDDSTYAQEVGLTTVRQDPFSIGRTAGKTALALIDGNTGIERHITVPSFLAIRNTTTPLR
ncbi:LacI family DNA-binding transcriptional regulator [Bifidobacterium sp. ESL0682]|uniref:LacI family DNA-binding transcriptional regulator n=1 Tax=Bifidobacterium sp. ESL0682 TaxID=2983212 RepID=UPI0023F9617C|nr:LacI family DNA-binding transcriptional regulator [Bifidobacterium sp. ESL0682]WEV42382.1 LacI family DNA-binding transcriptional regulator [Bifidobacterium sp. ESL0682]